MSRKRPTDQGREQAIHLFLSGPARDAAAFDLALAVKGRQTSEIWFAVPASASLRGGIEADLHEAVE